MLSRTSKEEVLHRLEAKSGRPIDEKSLSPATKKAVSSLAEIQRRLYVISEILNGEQGRIQSSAVLSLASRVRKDKEVAAHMNELEAIQVELDKKATEISEQVVLEEKARETGQPLPVRNGGLEAVQLKCPTCGAALTMPTGRFTKCEYCGSTISIQDVSSQIKSMIRNI
jgi:DNA-directed RNA polymerase subunit RPC12/RpoP